MKISDEKIHKFPRQVETIISFKHFKDFLRRRRKKYEMIILYLLNIFWQSIYFHEFKIKKIFFLEDKALKCFKGKKMFVY